MGARASQFPGWAQSNLGRKSWALEVGRSSRVHVEAVRSPEPGAGRGGEGGSSQWPVACESRGRQPFQISKLPLPASSPRKHSFPPSLLGLGWFLPSYAPVGCRCLFNSGPSLKAPEEAECLGTLRWDEEKGQGPRDTMPPSVPVGRGFTLCLREMYRHTACLELGGIPSAQVRPVLVSAGPE